MHPELAFSSSGSPTRAGAPRRGSHLRVEVDDDEEKIATHRARINHPGEVYASRTRLCPKFMSIEVNSAPKEGPQTKPRMAKVPSSEVSSVTRWGGAVSER